MQHRHHQCRKVERGCLWNQPPRFKVQEVRGRVFSAAGFTFDYRVEMLGATPLCGGKRETPNPLGVGSRPSSPIPGPLPPATAMPAKTGSGASAPQGTVRSLPGACAQEGERGKLLL